MRRLALLCNEDITSRISYSQQLLPLNDIDLASFITAELAAVGLGAHTFDDTHSRGGDGQHGRRATVLICCRGQVASTIGGLMRPFFPPPC